MLDRAEIIRQAKALEEQARRLVEVLSAIPEGAQALESLANLPLQPLEEPKSDLMTAKQVQIYLGIGESTFYTWIREGRLPPGAQWGSKTKRWSRKRLEEWRLGHREERIPVEL